MHGRFWAHEHTVSTVHGFFYVSYVVEKKPMK